jgi:DNA-binding transcriptional LysR family regulator
MGATMMPAFEVSYVPTALGLVKAGLGVALLALSAHETVRLEGLRARPIEHPMLVRHISLIERANRSLSPAAQEFARLMTAACRPAAPAAADLRGAGASATLG